MVFLLPLNESPVCQERKSKARREVLLSESRFLSFNHFIASVFLFLFFFCNCPQLQSSTQVMVKLQGTVEFIHTSCEQVLSIFFFFCSVLFLKMMTGTGNMLKQMQRTVSFFIQL